MCVDRYVILGGHRDAWVFGGIDPMSGAAVVHETVRGFGLLRSKGASLSLSFVNNGVRRRSGTRIRRCSVRVCIHAGWRPRRTLIFASWDAEEFGLQGSTEWAEVHIHRPMPLHSTCTHTHTEHT